MVLPRLPRLTVIAVLSGTVLLGWSLGGTASVGTPAGAVPSPAVAGQVHLVSDREHHGPHEHREL
jgi:hypothetical protein